MLTATGKLKHCTVEIEFEISGKYYPATRYEPEEYPEIDIVDITMWDKNGDGPLKLTDKQKENIIYSNYDHLSEICFKEAEDMRQEAMMERQLDARDYGVD